MFNRNPEVLETFNFLENADDSDEEDDDEGDIMEDVPDRSDKRRIKKHKIKVCNHDILHVNDLKVIILRIWKFMYCSLDYFSRSEMKVWLQTCRMTLTQRTL